MADKELFPIDDAPRRTGAHYHLFNLRNVLERAGKAIKPEQVLLALGDIEHALNEVASVPLESRSLTLDQFCFAENISPSTYYKLRNKGLAPEEQRLLDNIVRITPDSRRAWQERMAKIRDEKAAAKRVKRSRHAASAAVVSEKHISKRGPRKGK
jgi:hypothetical protein